MISKSGSCDQFYMCVRSGTLIKRFMGTCETGFEFSIETGMCTTPEDAGCSIPPTPTLTTTAAAITTTTVNPGGPTVPVPFVCQRPGLFPDETSCRHYHMCVRAAPAAGGGLHDTRLACPLILPHFNPVSRLCWFFSDTCAAGQCGL